MLSFSQYHFLTELLDLRGEYTLRDVTVYKKSNREYILLVGPNVFEINNRWPVTNSNFIGEIYDLDLDLSSLEDVHIGTLSSSIQRRIQATIKEVNQRPVNEATMRDKSHVALGGVAGASIVAGAALGGPIGAVTIGSIAAALITYFAKRDPRGRKVEKIKRLAKLSTTGDKVAFRELVREYQRLEKQVTLGDPNAESIARRLENDPEVPHNFGDSFHPNAQRKLRNG